MDQYHLLLDGTAHGLMMHFTPHALMPMESLVMRAHAKRKVMPVLTALMIKKLPFGTLTKMVETHQDTAMELVPGNGLVLKTIQETQSDASASACMTSRMMAMVNKYGLMSADTTIALALMKNQQAHLIQLLNNTIGLLMENSSQKETKVEDGSING